MSRLNIPSFVDTDRSRLVDVDGYAQKIDALATDGLGGVHDSLAYRVNEIERHFHHYERWFQKATTPVGETHVAVHIGEATGSGPFIADAGNNDWGAWVQFVGSTDTPTIVGSQYMDPHLLFVVNTERNSLYLFQIAIGTSGTAALAAGTYTETVFLPMSNQLDSGPMRISTRRVPVGTKMWFRVMCPGQNTGTVSAYFGGHEYEG